MVKYGFVLAITLYLSIFLSLSSASSSLRSSKKRYSSKFREIPRNISPPDWFKPAANGISSSSWNIFGQWFHQDTSKPCGSLVPLKSVESLNEFWSYLTPKQLLEIKRIDISLFRPGFSPDTKSSSDSGFILSYKVSDALFSKSTSSRLTLKWTKKDVILEKEEEEEVKLPEHFMKIFDHLISAVMSLSPDNLSALASDIIGFKFKRQYIFTFIQIYFKGFNLKESEAKNGIQSNLQMKFPSVQLLPPQVLKIPTFNSHFEEEEEDSLLSATPGSSPTKTTESAVDALDVDSEVSDMFAEFTKLSSDMFAEFTKLSSNDCTESTECSELSSDIFADYTKLPDFAGATWTAKSLGTESVDKVVEDDTHCLKDDYEVAIDLDFIDADDDLSVDVYSHLALHESEDKLFISTLFNEIISDQSNSILTPPPPGLSLQNPDNFSINDLHYRSISLLHDYFSNLKEDTATIQENQVDANESKDKNSSTFKLSVNAPVFVPKGFIDRVDSGNQIYSMDQVAPDDVDQEYYMDQIYYGDQVGSDDQTFTMDQNDYMNQMYCDDQAESDQISSESTHDNSLDIIDVILNEPSSTLHSKSSNDLCEYFKSLNK